MQLVHDILALLAPFEAWAFAAATAVTVAIGALADKRPLTSARLREGVLTSVIFMMLGMRGVIFAATTFFFSDLTVGMYHPSGVTVAVIACFAAVGLLGILCHRANAMWRTVGAVALAGTAIAETWVVGNGYGPAFSVTIDLVPVYAGAFIALALALTSWSNRTATPHPLRADEKPFDY